MMNVRVLTEGDAEEYRALRLRAQRAHPEAFASSYEEEVNRPLGVVAERLRVAAGESFVLGAVLDSSLIGIVGLWRESHQKLRHKGTIWGMYVAPEARGRGVGKLLLSSALARARALEGLEQINLGVVMRNAAARSLYAAAGFTAYGLERRALKLGSDYLDEEHMTLRLADVAPAQED